MADYPDGVYSPREKENKAGVVYAPEKKTVGFAEDVTKLDDEVVATQTELGTNPRGVFASVKAFLAYLYDVTQSRARAYKSASLQAIPTGEFTKVVLDAKTYDEQGEFDHITHSRFTAQKAGYYLVTAQLVYVAAVPDRVYLAFIYKNGAAVARGISVPAATYDICPRTTDIIYLGVNHYVEMYTYHAAGVEKNIMNASSQTFMSIHRLS